jgi:hypothetical protein
MEQDARRGAITDKLESAQFCKTVEQGDAVPEDRPNHPKQEKESRGERHSR